MKVKLLRPKSANKARSLPLQAAVAQGLRSIGLEFSEEVLEPVTGYRVDMMLHGSGADRGCALEVATAFQTM